MKLRKQSANDRHRLVIGGQKGFDCQFRQRDIHRRTKHHRRREEGQEARARVDTKRHDDPVTLGNVRQWWRQIPRELALQCQ
jgi:hypothetical protein